MEEILRHLLFISILFAASATVWAEENRSPSKLVLFQQDNKWGYLDYMNRVAIAAQFAKATEFHEGFAAVAISVAGSNKLEPLDGSRVRVSPREELRWGFIDEAGKTVIPPQFAAVREFSEGLTAVTKVWPFSDCRCWGYVDSAGNLVIRPQFDMAGPFSDGLALVKGGGVSLFDPIVKSFVSMGFIDKSGKWIIRSKFEYFYYNSFSEGLAPFRRNGGKWGYIDRSGAVAIKPEFDWAGVFSVGMAPVLTHGACSFIDKAGKIFAKQELSKQSDSTKEAKTKQWERARGTLTFNPQVPPCP